MSPSLCCLASSVVAAVYLIRRELAKLGRVSGERVVLRFDVLGRSALRPYVGGVCKAGAPCLSHLRA